MGAIALGIIAILAVLAVILVVRVIRAGMYDRRGRRP